MEDIYKNIPVEKIPWNREEPPELLRNLVEQRHVSPCAAFDSGCGAGNYSVYLAEKGFSVTGVDRSPSAIDLAEKKARERGVKCVFLVGDILERLDELENSFDFIFDWGLLHHIFPEKRRLYLDNVDSYLRQGGVYMSVCFSQEDKAFGGKGKYRDTRLGTRLYFSSEDELSKLFGFYFTINQLSTVTIDGKFESHTAIYTFMQKR